MNVSGKQLLKNIVKYYIVDPGLRNYLVPRQNYDLGFLLENIVYLELRRRGYEVYIGKMKDLEVDFIAQKSGVCQYFQITANCSAKETFEREIMPLQKIKDNYKKTILIWIILLLAITEEFPYKMRFPGSLKRMQFKMLQFRLLIFFCTKLIIVGLSAF